MGDVSQLQTQSKQLVGAVNEVLAGSGNDDLNQVYVQGENNSIDGFNNVVVGNGNIVTGNNNFIIGDKLIVMGNDKSICLATDIYSNQVEIGSGQIFFSYNTEQELPFAVGDKVCLNITSIWLDESFMSSITTETGRYVTVITELNLEPSYIKVADFRMPPDGPPEYPYVDMYNVGFFEPLLSSRKINGSGGIILGDSCEGYKSATLNIGKTDADYALACNCGETQRRYGFAANFGRVFSENGAAFNFGYTCGAVSFAINYGKAAGRAIKCSALSGYEKSITAEATENLSGIGAGSLILLRYKNNSNPIMHQPVPVTAVTGQKIYFAHDIYFGQNGEALMPDGYVFAIDNSYMSSFAQGNSTAGGYYAHASGNNALAVHEGSSICGKYGISPESYSWALANGTSFNNMELAVKMLSNGNVCADGTFSSPCADYSECFEWQDGNPDNEDKSGYFVALEGEKIRKAGLFEPFVLGVVSGNPAILGDSSELHWNGKYQTDDFGRVIYHDVLLPAITEEIEEPQEDGTIKKVTITIKEETIERQPMLNPSWDNTQEYIPRINRKEWAAVGVLGKLVVYDDGTCEVGGLCQPNADGKATKALNNGHKVLKRVANDKVLIWFRG